MGQLRVEVSFLCKIHELRDTAALWVDQELRASVLSEFLVDNIRRYSCVNVALARPNLHVSPGLLFDVGAKEEVWQEENFPISGNAVNNFDGVAGCADVVAFRFDLGGCVDI